MFQTEQIKSINQLWKESNTTLSFTEWLEREKLKGIIPENKTSKDTLQTIQKMIDPNASKSNTNEQNKKLEIFGLNAWVVLGALVVISGAYIYSKTKK